MTVLPALTARLVPVRRALSVRAFAFAGVLGPLLALGLGCSGDHLTQTQPVAPDSLYWALDLNHRAVVMSIQPPYDTLTLVATARTSRGEPLPDLGTPTYSSSDLERVQVTPEGLLRARAVTAPEDTVRITVTQKRMGITYTETVLVRVTADTLPKPASLSIHPLPPDSTKIAADINGGVGFPLSVRVTDSSGSPMAAPLVAIRSSDPSTAQVVRIPFPGAPPYLHGDRLGTVTLVASATVFGVVMADTVTYQVGWPVLAGVLVRREATAAGDSVTLFDPPEQRVGAGATVPWILQGVSDTIDVTFAEHQIANVVPLDASHVFFTASPLVYLLGSVSAVYDVVCRPEVIDCGGGNIVLTPERMIARRVFPTPGTYEYHSARSGASGRIVVVAE